MPTSLGIGGRRYSTDSRTGLQRRGRLSRPRRFTMHWPSFMITPVYNTAADSSIGSRGRLGRD